MVKNGGNKVTMVRLEQNSLSIANKLTKLLDENFENCEKINLINYELINK